MNVKIKASGVYCLVNDDYDRVYAALQKQLGNGPDQIFSERIPGHEYLQWSLPGEGWLRLSDADPVMAAEVRRQWLQRQRNVAACFGANTAMAQKVLTVPDESYVYYKPDADGSVIIRQVAWGYRYPVRVGGDDIHGAGNAPIITEPVVLTIVAGGMPCACRTVKINGFARTTDSEGCIDLGDIPVGYSFTVGEGDKTRNITVTKGNGRILVDFTERVKLNVRVECESVPVEGAVVKLSTTLEETELTSDAAGTASTLLQVGPDEEDPSRILTATCNEATATVVLRSETDILLNIKPKPVVEESDTDTDTDKDTDTDSDTDTDTDKDTDSETDTETGTDTETDSDTDTDHDSEQKTDKEIKPLPPLPVSEPRWPQILGAAAIALVLGLLTYITYETSLHLLFD